MSKKWPNDIRVEIEGEVYWVSELWTDKKRLDKLVSRERERCARVCEELAVQALKNAYRSGFAYLFCERTLAKRLSECFNEAAGKIRGES